MGLRRGHHRGTAGGMPWQQCCAPQEPLDTVASLSLTRDNQPPYTCTYRSARWRMNQAWKSTANRYPPCMSQHRTTDDQGGQKASQGHRSGHRKGHRRRHRRGIAGGIAWGIAWGITGAPQGACHGSSVCATGGSRYCCFLFPSLGIISPLTPAPTGARDGESTRHGSRLRIGTPLACRSTAPQRTKGVKRHRRGTAGGIARGIAVGIAGGTAGGTTGASQWASQGASQGHRMGTA